MEPAEAASPLRGFLKAPSRTPPDSLHEKSIGPHDEERRRCLTVVRASAIVWSSIDERRRPPAARSSSPLPNEEERRRTLLERSNIGGSYEGGWPTKRTPLHLACEYCAPPALTLKLLSACSEAAATADEHGWLPCHSIAGQDATEASESALAAILTASRLHMASRGVLGVGGLHCAGRHRHLLHVPSRGISAQHAKA